MENNINIVELLKDAPFGTELYSLDEGPVRVAEITLGRAYPIHTTALSDNSSAFYTSDGKVKKEGECLLFPSKDCRTWEDFKAPWLEKNHKHFEPFQKVLVNVSGRWFADIYSHQDKEFETLVHCTIGNHYFVDSEIIPYCGNEDKLGKEVKE